MNYNSYLSTDSVHVTTIPTDKNPVTKPHIHDSEATPTAHPTIRPTNDGTIGKRPNLPMTLTISLNTIIAPIIYNIHSITPI